MAHVRGHRAIYDRWAEAGATGWGSGYVRDGVADGGLVDAAAGGELILAAGAIGSPHLLLRSGLGPAGDLRALGIDPVADLADEVPDLHLFPILLPLPSAAGYEPPAAGFPLVAAAMTPDSRGTVW